jgi:hypothetical protein
MPVRLREEIQEMLRRGDGELSGPALCLTITVRNVLRKPQAREGAARGHVPVWARGLATRYVSTFFRNLSVRSHAVLAHARSYTS